MIRIIGGEHRSRRLAGPADESASRPYANRVKESVFNLLRGWWAGARVLDLFAGVGTMGLEAASRGAASVLMVERSKPIYAILRENVEALGCGDRAETLLGDALGPVALARAPRPVDVVFLDPPYDLMREPASRRRVLEQAARCRDIMAGRSFLILRTPLDPGDADHAVEGLEGPEIHDYGTMRVLLYAPPV